ncbi:Lsr2 family protein [Microbacterium sp. SL62]|uniref:histone-like nucleoid-structuring protein Lsr2 n=1 Tax=Microbacterium sp. SL62 TaxID=2995139 RepID=UPI0022757476|nr:Lsr2 family protein [Microbacterium sp. SL62]MCY1715958.1 Lsr2 family protein [Microbacterium sp. SL62]
MAQRKIIQMVDDLDGAVIEDGETVHFSIDGRVYEVDLSRRNAQTLRDILAPYVAAGRRSGGPARTRRAASTRDVEAIRRWATANGFAVSDKGRMSNTVLEAYRAANHSSSRD